MVPVHTETWALHFPDQATKYETIRVAIPSGKLQNTRPWPPQLTPSKYQWEPCSHLVNRPQAHMQRRSHTDANQWKSYCRQSAPPLGPLAATPHAPLNAIVVTVGFSLQDTPLHEAATRRPLSRAEHRSNFKHSNERGENPRRAPSQRSDPFLYNPLAAVPLLRISPLDSPNPPRHTHARTRRRR